MTFAAAYVFMQVGRTMFFLWAVRHDAILVRNFQRVLAWFVLSAVFWIIGGFAEGEARLASWAVALGVDCFAPIVYFWVPGLGARAPWNGTWMATTCPSAVRCS